MKTMICLILDRSGSMQGRERDVVGGVNSFVEEQKKLPDPASIAFVRFDSNATERFRPMMALSEVKPLELQEFQPRGSTPLLDAVGRTIGSLDDDWKREQPDRAIVVIVTDGYENASYEYSKTQIKQMIQARENSGKWTFIYLGADVNAFAEAASMGVKWVNTASYMNTAHGTASMYKAASDTVGVMRATGALDATNLGGAIGEDGFISKTANPPVTIVNPPPVGSSSAVWNVPTGPTTWTPPA